MQRFVLDEWILHDLNGDWGPENQRQTYYFLERMHKLCDSLAVLDTSPWTRKFHRLFSAADRSLEAHTLFKFLDLSFMRNSNKCRIVYNHELQPLPSTIHCPVKDQYLVQLYLTCGANLLVTTDTTLEQALSGTDIQVRLRDSFLGGYLASKP